jgi:galactitol-specific phosphotransferase system IIC component
MISYQYFIIVFLDLLSHAIGPAARTLLEQYGLELSKIQGTGPHGVVMKRFSFFYFSSIKFFIYF